MVRCNLLLDAPVCWLKIIVLNRQLTLINIDSEDFERTKEITFDLYRRYQTQIHNDPPADMCEFNNFLCSSPIKVSKVWNVLKQFRGGGGGGALGLLGLLNVLGKKLALNYCFFVAWDTIRWSKVWLWNISPTILARQHFDCCRCYGYYAQGHQLRIFLLRSRYYFIII